MKKILTLFLFIFITLSLSAQRDDTTTLKTVDKIKNNIETQNLRESRNMNKDEVEKDTPLREVTKDSYGESNGQYKTDEKVKKRRDYTPPTKFQKHEVGLESGAFFAQVFRLFGLVKDTQIFPVAPYQFTYKYRINKNGGIRIGLGAEYSKDKEQLGGFADSKTFTKNNYSGRLGYEFNTQITERWMGLTGFDMFTSYQNDIKFFDSGFDKNRRTIRGFTFGFGFIAGFRYDINGKMGIGSETTLGFFSKKTDEIDEFTSNPQFNKKVSTKTESGLKFYGPANIFLSYRF